MIIPYSFETTIGELVDTRETRAVIEEVCPALLEHPLLEAGRGYPIGTVIPFFAQLMTEETIETLRARLEAL